jgi:hypothetical protein
MRSVRLAGSLAVSSVSSPEFGPLMALRVSGQNTVLISLPRPLERDTELVLNVTYSGRLESQGLDREAIAPQGTTSQAQEPEPARLIPEARYLYSNRTVVSAGPVADYAPARMRLSDRRVQVVASGTLVSLSQQGRRLRRAPHRLGTHPHRRVGVGSVARYLAWWPAALVPLDQSRRRAAAPPFVSPRSRRPAGQGAAAWLATTPGELRRARSDLDAAEARRGRQMTARIGTSSATTRRRSAKRIPTTLAAIDDNLPGGHSPPSSRSPSGSADDAVFVVVRPGGVRRAVSAVFVAHEVAHQWWGQAVGGRTTTSSG